MIKSYWVQYRYRPDTAADWDTLSTFVDVGVHEDFDTLECWWSNESDSSCEHELLQVVKL